MKDNKKMYVMVIVLIVLIMSVTFFWPTPIKTDLRNLSRNSEILKENYEVMLAEINTWNTNLQGDNLQYSVNTLLGDFQYGVNNVIVPKVENSITILELTELSTPEVIALREQYINSLELFKEGSEKMLAAVKANDNSMYKEAEALLTQSEQEIQSFYTNFKTLARKNHFIYFD